VPLSSELFGYSTQTKRNPYDNYYWQRPQVRILSQLPESEKAEYIRKTIGEIRFANRERYRGWSGGRNDYFYDD
jgi:hypothetical protein